MGRIILILIIAALFSNCKKQEDLPVLKISIKTLPVKVFTSSTATLPAMIADSGEGIKLCGHYYWQTKGPGFFEITSISNVKYGGYSSEVTDLKPGTGYSVVAYANDGKADVFGDTLQFNTHVEITDSGEFTDIRDGNVYPWVKIGNQIWMAKNLAYLPSLNLAYDESYTRPKYYVYGYNDTASVLAHSHPMYLTYGVLYNWTAAMDSTKSSDASPSGVQGVCPCGWHLPSDAEWLELINYLGGLTVAAPKLKEKGLSHWYFQGGSNESHFNGLPGGVRYVNKYSDGENFMHFHLEANWWTSTIANEDLNCPFSIYLPNDELFNSCTFGACGNSVRCVKD